MSFIPLVEPNSKEARACAGPKFVRASIISLNRTLEDDEGKERMLHEPVISRKPEPPFLWFKTCGYPYAFHFLLRANFKLLSGSTKTAELRFYPNGFLNSDPQVLGVRLDPCFLDDEQLDTTCPLTLKFTTTGAFSHQLFSLDTESLEPASAGLLSVLQELDEQTCGGQVVVNLKLCLDSPATEKALMMDQLRALRKHDVRLKIPAYGPWHDESKFYSADKYAKISRYELKERIGFLTKLPAHNSMSSIHEWSLCYGYGYVVDFQQKKQLDSDLRGPGYAVTFKQLPTTGSKVFTAVVKFKNRAAMEDLYRMESGSPCKIEVFRNRSHVGPVDVMPMRSGKFFEPTAGVTPMVCLPDIPYKIAEDIESKGAPHSPTTYEARLTILDLQSEKNHERITGVVPKILTAPECQRWHGVITARDPAGLEPVDVVNIKGSRAAQLAWTQVMRHPKFQSSEKDALILRSFFRIRGGIGIIKEPLLFDRATAVLAAVHVIIRSGGSVLVILPHLGTARTFLSKLLQFEKQTDLSNPFMTVYPTNDDQRLLVRQIGQYREREGELEGLELWDLEAEVLLRQHLRHLQAIKDDDAKDALLRDPLLQHSVDKKVINQASQGARFRPALPITISQESYDALRATFQHWPRRRPQQVGTAAGPHYTTSAYDIIRLYLTRLFYQRSFKAWPFRLLDVCEQAFSAAIAAEVSQARVVVTSGLNTTVDPIKTHFGHNANSIVVINYDTFDDDELSTLAPLASLSQKAKIKALYLVGSDKYSIVKDVPGPWFLSEKTSPGFNEFASQIVKTFAGRLLACGMPEVQDLGVGFNEPANDEDGTGLDGLVGALSV